MNKFITVVEPKAQEELAALGFTYTKTKVNGKDVYAFAATVELQKYLSERYSDEECSSEFLEKKRKKGGRSET